MFTIRIRKRPFRLSDCLNSKTREVIQTEHTESEKRAKKVEAKIKEKSNGYKWKYYRSTADFWKTYLQKRRRAIRESVAKQREAIWKMSSNELSSNNSIQSSSKVSKRRLIFSLAFKKPRRRSCALKKKKIETSQINEYEKEIKGPFN